MKIRTPPKLTNRESVTKYIEVNLWSWLRDLTVGLLKMDFQSNFQSFRIDNLKIAAGVEIAIPNQLSAAYPGTIPSMRVITRQRGEGVIVDGDQEWTASHVFLKNPSANDIVISVVFFM